MSEDSRTLRGSRVLGTILIGAAALFAVLLFGHIGAVLLGPPPPGEGALAPAFAAATPDGLSASLGDYRGRVVLLDFWARDCPGCVGATPKLNRLQARYEQQGFAVLSLSQEPGEEEGVLRFMERRQIGYRVLMDPGAIATDYGVYALPTVVLVDRGGLIRAVHRGAVSEEHLAKEIEALLALPTGR